jgi:DNA-directed RNA polymerase subunit L
MEIELDQKGKGEIGVTIKERNPTMPELVVHYLNNMDGVEFAGYEWAHPVASWPRIIIRASGEKKALSLLNDAIDDIRKDISSLKEAVKKAE